ncbi:hypothetical protein VE00_11023 [Pseudogymnoascus sp. WSF 3629]|nr:hypothetical protein VE00_11023 [Pseudogymnoascus sp. WSF 3629]
MSTNGITTDEKSNGTTNNESVVSKSQFLSHLQTYPLLTSFYTTLTTHPYATTPLSLTHRTIDTLTPYATPFVTPVAPYVTPYLVKLDSLADSGLSAFDARVPAAKKPTQELYDEARTVVLTPYTLSKEGSEFVWKTYEGEVKRADAKGVIGYSRAVVGTGFVVGGQVIHWARGEGKKVVNGEKA